jgi:hypothetical protein
MKILQKCIYAETLMICRRFLWWARIFGNYFLPTILYFRIMLQDKLYSIIKDNGCTNNSQLLTKNYTKSCLVHNFRRVLFTQNVMPYSL